MTEVPRFARFSIVLDSEETELQLPILGGTHYRVSTSRAVSIRGDESISVAVAEEGFRAPRIYRRFEQPAQVPLSGVTITPVAFGAANTAAVELMREIRAMRFLSLYPVIGKPAALPSPAPPMEGAASPFRIAAVVHLHYGELWPELASYLRAIPGAPPVIVTLTAEDPQLAGMIREDFPRADVRVVPNRGYDIAPFVSLLNSGALDEYDLICKIHGKKSVRRDGSASLIGEAWRAASLQSVLADAPRVIRRFVEDRDLGLAGPGRFHMAETGFRRFLAMRRNRLEMIRLAGQMGLPWHRVPLDFYAGAMFWVRPAALRPLRELALPTDRFPAPGKRDGTLAHVVERLFNISVTQAGFTVVDLP